MAEPTRIVIRLARTRGPTGPVDASFAGLAQAVVQRAYARTEVEVTIEDLDADGIQVTPDENRVHAEFVRKLLRLAWKRSRPAAAEGGHGGEPRG